jgi:hypothetical protein
MSGLYIIIIVIANKSNTMGAIRVQELDEYLMLETTLYEWPRLDSSTLFYMYSGFSQNNRNNMT